MVPGHSRKQQKAAWLIFLKWKKRDLCYVNCTVQMVFSILHALLVVAMSCLWRLWQATLTSQRFHHCLVPNELWRKKLGWVERPQLGEISHTQQASPTHINRADRGKAGEETEYWRLEGSTWGLQSTLNHMTYAYRFEPKSWKSLSVSEKVTIEFLSQNIQMLSDTTKYFFMHLNCSLNT